MTDEAAMETIIYECSSCGAYHPWSFDGDCQDDNNKYGGPQDYAERNDLESDDIEVGTIEDGDEDEDIEWDHGEDGFAGEE